MSDRGKHRIPVLESIFSLYDLFIFWLEQIRKVERFCFAIGGHHLFSFDNIALFKFFFEPLIDLIFCLCTLDYIQPVTAWSFRILGGQNFYSVSILDSVINRNKLSIHSGTDHLIADCTVYGISKVDWSGPRRQCLYIPLRCKAVHIICKQIQISFDEA